MIKLFLLSFITTQLFSSDIANIYRDKGIGATQKALDSLLTTPNYWKPIIKNSDTSFGYFSELNSLLICNKSNSLLKFYKKDSNSTFVLQNKYQAFTGKNSGDKEHEGDLKTPIGVYKITKRIDKLDDFYGPLAFVTSYPNIYDTYQNKDGSGIWIHGLPIHQKRDTFTKGCIAIGNKEIECLDKNLLISNSLLVINRDTYPKEKKQEYITILSELYRWRSAWLYNDINSYLSFYSKAFKRYDGLEYQEFKKYKTTIFSRKQEKEIIFTNISIIPYPDDTKKLYIIYFHENYKSKNYAFQGEKNLIVELSNKNKIKILVEK